MDTGDLYNVLELPAKRNKGNDGRWQHSGWLTTNTPTSSPADRTEAYNITVADGNQSQSVASGKRRKTSTRTPYFDLIQDALIANPEGLCSNDVFEWLRTHRPHEFGKYEEKKLRASVQSTLSAQSNKPEPTVWKYKVDSAEGLGYIWQLADSAPLVEATSARGILQTPVAADYRRDEAECSQEDTRAPASLASPAHDLQRAQSRRMTPARVHGHDDSNSGDAQIVETEAAALHGDGTQQSISDTIQDSEDFAHQLPRTTSEPLSTTQPKPPAIIQPQTHTQDEDKTESAMARSDSAASKVGEADRRVDMEEGSLDSDHEDQLRYGKLVKRLRRMKDQRERQIQKIEAERNALPDIQMLEKTVEETAEKVAELRRVLEEACQLAETARKDLEVTLNKTREIKIAEREVEQLKVDSKELRSQLGID
jgi:hypothetical protein